MVDVGRPEKVRSIWRAAEPKENVNMAGKSKKKREKPKSGTKTQALVKKDRAKK